MASSVAAVYRRRAEALEDAPRRIAKDAAVVMSKAILDQARRDSGGDLRLSGVPSSRLGLKTTLSGGTPIAIAQIEANPKRARGPWSWLESGTSRHVVRARRRFGKRRRTMRVGGEWATGPWEVRGMTAKRTFSRGVEGGEDPVRRVEARVVEAALR